MSWYSVRCIFKWRDHPQYEERITVWQATSAEAAIERAEADAMEYAADTDLEYLRLAQAYDLRTDVIEDGSEVFSLTRTSALDPKEYLNHFFDTGSEAERTIES